MRLGIGSLNIELFFSLKISSAKIDTLKKHKTKTTFTVTMINNYKDNKYLL